MNPYYDLAYHVECPMADCIEVLFLTWELSLTLSPDDLAGHDPADSESGSWKVECLAGHVILLPATDLGCPCEDDGGGVNCPHDDTDYDWQEESRAFRASDAVRLHELIAVLDLANRP